MAQAPRDQNRVPTLLGVDSITFTTPTTAAVNPSTHAVLVEAAITPSGTQDVNLVSIAGTAISLGQKAMTSSLPIVIASDQTSIPVAATLSAETTKVIGTVNQGTSPWVTSATQSGNWSVRLQDGSGNAISSTASALDINIKSGNPTTITVTQATGTNLHTVIDSGTITTVSAVTAITNALPAGSNVIGHVITDTGSTTAVTGTVTTSEAVATTIFNGKTTVTTAGTRVTLAASQAIKSVTIKALAANTGTIFVGNTTVASTNGLALAAGEAISMDIANLNTVNIDSSVNGEGVTYLGIN